MNETINVVYDKETKRVIVVETDGMWVLPKCWDLATFKNGAEPVFANVNGDMYIKPNAIIATPEYSD